MACAAGKYQASSGQTTCTNCPTGTSQPLTGKTSCTACAAGTYQNATGQTSCTDCSLGTTYQNATGQTSCKTCSVCEYAESTSSSCSLIADTGCTEYTGWDCVGSNCFRQGGTCDDGLEGEDCFAGYGTTGECCDAGGYYEQHCDYCPSTPQGASGSLCNCGTNCTATESSYKCECSVPSNRTSSNPYTSNCSSCATNYYGTSCVYCTRSSTCSNHGTCINSGSSYACSCDSGWSGSDCSTSTSSCAGDEWDCEGDGSCCAPKGYGDGTIDDDCYYCY